MESQSESYSPSVSPIDVQKMARAGLGWPALLSLSLRIAIRKKAEDRERDMMSRGEAGMTSDP